MNSFHMLKEGARVIVFGFDPMLISRLKQATPDATTDAAEGGEEFFNQPFNTVNLLYFPWSICMEPAPANKYQRLHVGSTGNLGKPLHSTISFRDSGYLCDSYHLKLSAARNIAVRIYRCPTLAKEYLRESIMTCLFVLHTMVCPRLALRHAGYIDHDNGGVVILSLERKAKTFT